MTKTDSVKINPTKIKSKLVAFDSVEDELNSINKLLIDASNKKLKPIDFYAGTEKDIGSDFANFQEKFISTITAIKNYIDGIAKADGSGGFGGLADISEGLLIPIDISVDDNLYNQENLESEQPVVGDIPIIQNTYNTSQISITEDVVAGISEVDGQTVIDTIHDSNDKIIAVSVIKDGKKIWYQVINDKVVMPQINTNNTYFLREDIEIIVDGKMIRIAAGNYNIDQVICNPDGSVKSIRILCDDYKLWLYLDNNGNINRVEYIRAQSGVFVIDNPNYDIIDMYGNIMGKFSEGNYYIYDVLYDSNGNIVAFKLSIDGKYEQWLYVNGSDVANKYSLFGNNQDNGKVSLSLFDNNKGLFGLLGVLFVSLGAVIVLKKRQSKKENNNSFQEETDEWEEELSDGNYAVYDVKRNDDGLVTEARINPLDEDEEYWVKM